MSVPDPTLARWIVYRIADGAILLMQYGLAEAYDAALADLPPDQAARLMTPDEPFEPIRRYGVVDVDDPAHRIAFNKDKLDGDGTTLADVLEHQVTGDGGEAWRLLPVKKPMLAR